MKLTKEDYIDNIKSRVWHRSLTTISELEEEIERVKKESGYEIEPHEDILSLMGWNCCDRCGGLEDTEQGLLWLDFYDWDDENPEDKKLLEALEKEEQEYCAICWDCVKVLKEKNVRKNFDELYERTKKWAEEHGIDNMWSQASKVTEEWGETIGEMNHNRFGDDFEDGIGDVMVSFVIYTIITHKDLLICWEKALKEIEGRTGKTLEGNFIKKLEK